MGAATEAMNVAFEVSHYPADTTRPILNLTVGDLLREAAAEVPERQLLVSISPDREPRTWTYGQLSNLPHGSMKPSPPRSVGPGTSGRP